MKRENIRNMAGMVISLGIIIVAISIIKMTFLPRKRNFEKANVNAIAQGYTSDKIGAFFESKGITNYLVDVGGEVLAFVW